jgi:hypothetical protein
MNTGTISTNNTNSGHLVTEATGQGFKCVPSTFFVITHSETIQDDPHTFFLAVIFGRFSHEMLIYLDAVLQK